MNSETTTSMSHFQNKEIIKIAELFKVLGDPTRIKIISFFSKGEACVSELSQQLEISKSATSHQLRVLKNYNIVNCHREGKMIIYNLNNFGMHELLSQTKILVNRTYK